MPLFPVLASRNRLPHWGTIAKWHLGLCEPVQVLLCPKPDHWRENLKNPRFILLITSDQQRADSLGTYGSKTARSPHLDALGAEGTVFERAYCSNSICIPSRACIVTGRYPHQHGVEYMEDVVDDTPGLPPWETTFMERLQRAGIRTAAFGKMHLYPLPPRGFDEMKLTGGQGARWEVSSGSPLGPGPLGEEYASWLDQKRPGAYESIYAQRRTEEYKRHRSAVTSVLSFDEYVDTWTADNTIDYFRRHRDSTSPIFAWCGFCNPHAPYDAPKPYDSMYDPAKMTISDTFMRDMSDRPAHYMKRQGISGKNLTPDMLKRIMAYYFGLCTMVDDLCGRIFNQLKAMGIWEETLVIFTTDHGELLGDYGLFNKNCFFESVINVPLIIKPAGGHPAVRRTKGMAELIDIAATVLQSAGIEKPPFMEADSLLPVMEGKSPGKGLILSEYTEGDRSRKGKCVRTARYKYNFWMPGSEEELYDMDTDPLETRNIAGDPAYAGILSDMRVKMISRLTDSEKPLLGPG